jgi:hypothetical protein
LYIIHTHYFNVYQDGTHTHNPKKKLNLLGVSTKPGNKENPRKTKRKHVWAQVVNENPDRHTDNSHKKGVQET